VTNPTPSADDTLGQLRRQVDELTLVLQSARPETADPVQLKQSIYLLHRAVAQHAQLLGELQDEVRLLVDGWKTRYASHGADTEAPPAFASAGDPPRRTPPHGVRSSTPIDAPVLEVAFSTRTPTPVLTPVPTPAPAPAAIGALSARATVTPAQGQPRVIDELNASTFVERGWSRIAAGDFTAAESALEQALALNPGDAQAETLLGWALMAQERFDEAAGWFDRVLERQPQYALAHLNLGYVHLRRGEHDAALERLLHAITLDSDRKATLYAYFYLGLVRYEQELFAESAGALLRAIELGPNLIEARFELGRVYWFSGRTDDAIATWRKGAEVNKFNAWSARCREMLATIADGGAPSRAS